MSPLYKLAVMVSLVDKMTGPAKKVFGQLKNYEQMIATGRGWADYGKHMSVSGAMVQGAADQMINALSSVLGPTTAVNDEIAKLETVTTSTMGSMTQSMNTTRKAAFEWSKIHADTAAKFVTASTVLGGAGLNDIQAIEGTRASLTLAKGTFGEAGEAAELMGVLYNNMGNKAISARKEMGRLADVVTVTQQLNQIKNMGQLAEGYKYAVPSALQHGSSLEEVSAIVGALNTVGLAGGQAGTAYAATMRQMIKASNELGFAIGRNAEGGVSLIKTMENIRAKYGDFNSMSDVTKVKFQQAFGDEGLRAISLLMGKTGDLNKALKAITNSAGAAAKAQATVEQKSPTEQYQILRNNIDAVKDSIAVNLIPSILGCIPVVTALLDRFGRFAEAHPLLTKLAVGGFALIAVLLAIVAPIMSVAGGFIMMAGYGLEGIGRIAKQMQHLQKVLTSSKLLGGIKSFGAMARTGFLTAARAAWTFTAALLANPITWIVLGIVAVAAGAYLIIKNWSKVKAFFVGLWNSITSIWNNMPGWMQGLVNGLLIAFMPIVGIPLLIVRNWERIKQVGTFLADLAKQAFRWGGNLIGMFVEGIKQKISTLKNGLFNTAAEIKRYLGFSSPTDAGPGAAADKWAPNLMRMYQAGIVAGTPGVQRAALGTAMAVSMALASGSGAPALAMGGPPLSTPGGAPVRAVSTQAPKTSDDKQIIFKNCNFTVIANNPNDLFEQLRDIAEESGSGDDEA